MVHDRKLQWDHNLAFEIMVQTIPELGTKFFVAISDREFNKVMKVHFKKAFVAADEIHAVKDIERYVHVMKNI